VQQAFVRVKHVYSYERTLLNTSAGVPATACCTSTNLLALLVLTYSLYAACQVLGTRGQGREAAEVWRISGHQFACFTSTKVRMLTLRKYGELSGHAHSQRRIHPHDVSRQGERGQGGTKFTCFTSTKVRILILTPPEELGVGQGFYEVYLLY
jgi:hypothetical protein